MWPIKFIALFLITLFVDKEKTGELISDENEARKFLDLRQEASYNKCIFLHDRYLSLKSGNVFELNMTTKNFTWQNFTNPVLRRAFQVTAQTEAVQESVGKIADLKEGKRINEIWTDMRIIYLIARACIYQGGNKNQTDENCTTINLREIDNRFEKIGNIEERKYYWVAWRNAVGKMRDIYDESMWIFKRLKMFPNYNEWWLNPYEETVASIRQDIKRIWKKILPLYKQLHAFIRRRLIRTYGSNVINSNGPIPSHLLGLRTRNWWKIKEISFLYSEGEIKVTETLKDKIGKILDMYKLSEDFYHSLGLPYIDKNIWDISVFKENVYCPPNFHFTCKGEIDLLGICTDINEFNLHRVFGNTLDIYIANLERSALVRMDKRLSNPAFSPALKTAAELSSWTNEYLHQTGFIEAIPTRFRIVNRHDINLLMKVALRFLPMLPYIYKVMNWRWDSFDFLISKEDYNKRWWEYSLEYEGICPPVERTEEHFDPASSQDMAGNMPAIRDFIGIIYGFQFYKAACEEAGHEDLLHRCNLYGDKTFGDKIRNIIYVGKSARGPEAISYMTYGKSDSMDAKPLLEYFQPLYEWLRRTNEKETIGWQSNNSMKCP